jgi:hypothetical protein
MLVWGGSVTHLNVLYLSINDKKELIEAFSAFILPFETLVGTCTLYLLASP